MASPESLQMDGAQPHPHAPSGSPPTEGEAQPVSGTQERGLVLKTRYPSACKECRRRKQKCSLTHPCTNCARRFPQPTCDYGVAKVKRTWSSPPGSKANNLRAGAGGLYSHLDMDSVQDAILDVEGRLDLGDAYDNAFGIQTKALPQGYRLIYREQPVYSMKDESWSGGKPFIVKFRDKSGLLKDRNLIELVQYIMQTRLRVANRIVHDEWEIDGRQLIRALYARDEPRKNISSFEDQVQRLPMAPTRMNKELVRTHLQLLSRFKASLHGSPRPSNQFMKHWIPYSIQDRLVLHIVLCTTASFLHETGRLPKELLHIHRATAAQMLNEYISSPTLCTSDSAMLAVNQLILTSWYWSSTEELHAHMAGFKKMIQLRGSCQNLGMEGFTSKVALLNDAVIALCHDTESVIFGQPGFEFDDPFRVPLQVNFNSPFLFNCPPFLIPSSSLRLHEKTAEVLDSMRRLLQAVVELPDDADDAQLRTVRLLAASQLAYLEQLPEQVVLESDGGHDLASDISSGQKRKREEIDDAAPSSRRLSATDSMGGRSSDDPPDMVYLCVRLTALIWAQAVHERVPTQEVCSQTEFIRIWSFAWAAGLDRWSSLCGIYAWMNIAIAPLCHATIHARMVKTLTVTTFTYMGTENWHVAAGIASAALKMQAWLRKGKETKPRGAVSGAFGGEKAIEEFGFAFKENVPDLPDHRYERQAQEADVEE